MKVGHSVQIEVVGEDRRAAGSGEGDEFGVDIARLCRVVGDDLDRRRTVFLKPGQDFESTPAAGTSLSIRAVRDPLELVQNEARYHKPVI